MADRFVKISARTLAEILEFVRNPPGGGDMLRSVYDTDNDGKVDEAESADAAAVVSDGTNVSTASEVRQAVDSKATYDADYDCLTVTV